MNNKLQLISLIAILNITLFSCTTDEVKIVPEPWAHKTVDSMPQIVLTHHLVVDTLELKDRACAFTINTGKDTIAITCKHIFLVMPPSIKSISFDNKLKKWTMYPKKNPKDSIVFSKLINEDKKQAIIPEDIMYEDWLLLEIEKTNQNIYPLKIRYSSIKKNEIVYVLGWTNENFGIQKKYRLKHYHTSGNKSYCKMIDECGGGLSGAPVIDKNGYLVGISSGQEGNSAVINNVYYLKTQLQKYNIEFIEKL